ncbi:MAG TPA: NfeD family protein, partial [Chitinophagales bacterium]|nr:NfeD family protein [Chitinophagales bacterium]
IFGVGLILILLEIFIIPGFGIAGISGIVLTIAGLTLSLVRNIDFDFTFVPKGDLSLSLLMVSVAMALPLILLIAFGQKIFDSRVFKKMGVHTEMKTSDGYSVRSTTLQNLVGSTGMAITNLRPSGKVEINGEQYDSIADGSFIIKDAPVKVIRVQATYLVVQSI